MWSMRPLTGAASGSLRRPELGEALPWAVADRGEPAAGVDGAAVGRERVDGHGVGGSGEGLR